ncbi:major facilitator superfamily transporter [Phlyctema vagabunda]|uniref:Major facilitator superfamily transporter n=1 Tax=Phlyctema vagabunda TaxID=108571 RepID=A0ABR4PFG1_9HELO
MSIDTRQDQISRNSGMSPEKFEPEKDPERAATSTDTDQLQKPVNVAPDGGLEAWMVVAGAWCASFCTFGWINSVGTFQEYYESDLLKSYSSSTISWITPIVGKLYDNYGPRWLLLGGTFLHVFGLMMASISTKYYQLLLSQGICSAIGASAMFLPAFNCVAGYFDKKRAAAFGVIATGSSMGGVIFPIMVSRMIREVGFPWAMRTSAFIILLMLVIANLTIRARLVPKPTPFLLKDFIYPFKEVAFSLSVFGNLLFGFGVFIPVVYIVVQAIAEGMDRSLSQYLLAMLNAASLFGRLSAGLVADKIGRFNVFIIVSYMTGVLCLALWIPATGNAAIIVFAVLLGFFSGAYASLGPALVAQISPIEKIGVRTGLFFAFASISALTSGPIAGAILAHMNGSFLGVKIFSGVLCIAGASFVLCARVYKTGLTFKAKF